MAHFIMLIVQYSRYQCRQLSLYRLHVNKDWYIWHRDIIILCVDSWSFQHDNACVQQTYTETVAKGIGG
jgi:hypothetical protein